MIKYSKHVLQGNFFIVSSVRLERYKTYGSVILNITLASAFESFCAYKRIKLTLHNVQAGESEIMFQVAKIL